MNHESRIETDEETVTASVSLLILWHVFFVLFYALFVLCRLYVYLLFVCICVLNYCHRVATQLQLNIISYKNTSRRVRWEGHVARMKKEQMCIQCFGGEI
jgi:hypothetical protein